MNSKVFVIFALCYVICQSSAQIVSVTLGVHDLLRMQKGVGWPHELSVADGHEALLKVDQPWNSYDTCTITLPSGVRFDVQSPPSNRYERWTDGCGIRVHHVVATDEGRWRVNATRGNETAAGWTELFVIRDTPTYTGPEISLLDGQNNTQVDLTTLNNSYCVVAQPFSESSLVPGHCRVTLGRATRAVQGNWNVLLGLPGRVAELQVQRQVAVEAERLDVGYIRDSNTNKLNLYCNLLHTTKNITFCRFQKTSRAAGFNMIDGLSDGSYSYYGEGFLQRQCGMTIERPTALDYGTWRCSVGVQQWVNNNIQTQAPLQALISVGADSNRVGPTRVSDGEVETVFVQMDQTFTVMCRADASLAYCWFQHPNGTQFTPVPIVDEGQAFWYTGENLQLGDCGITFTHATQEEAGIWQCHMGPGNQIGLEITDRVEVRVTGPLAANRKEVATRIGDSVTLYCHSANGNKPLDYCRFLTPTAQGFRIDPTVTEENAILNRYYFTPGRNLDYGDCSLTIASVHEEDLGEWTCAALINEESVESRDTVSVYIDVINTRAGLSQAGIVGMVVGLFVLGAVLAGVIMYRRGWFVQLANIGRTEHSNSQARIVTMSGVARNSIGNGSQSSEGSTENVVNSRS